MLLNRTPLVIFFPYVISKQIVTKYKIAHEYAANPSILNWLSVCTYPYAPAAIVSSAKHERREGSSRPRKIESHKATARGVQERKMMTVSTFEWERARMLQ